ncbi:MAG: hypothetical protein IKI31_00075 [Treponema sp.]|nr:hypothetical protein [Treponema sp.]
MYGTLKGYYNGKQIELDSYGQLEIGQEVIVTYSVPDTKLDSSDRLKILNSLVGTIPDSGKTLEEYKAERLNKYATID